MTSTRSGRRCGSHPRCRPLKLASDTRHRSYAPRAYSADKRQAKLSPGLSRSMIGTGGVLRPTRIRSVLLPTISVVTSSVVPGSVVVRSEVLGSVKAVPIIARSVVAGSVGAVPAVAGAAGAVSVVAVPIVAGRGRRGSGAHRAQCTADHCAGRGTSAASGNASDRRPSACAEQAATNCALTRIIRVSASRQAYRQSQGKCAG